MKFWGQRIGNGLYPLDLPSMEQFERLPWRKPIRVEAKQKRNEGFHRLFFALCNRIASGTGREVEDIVRAFKYETGRYTTYRTIGGRELIQPDSIGFEAMDQIAFKAFFEECVAVMYQKWGIDPKDVADLLNRPEWEEMRRR